MSSSLSPSQSTPVTRQGGIVVPWSAASILVAAWGTMGALNIVSTPIAPWAILMATPFIAAIGIGIEMRRGKAITLAIVQPQPSAGRAKPRAMYAVVPSAAPAITTPLAYAQNVPEPRRVTSDPAPKVPGQQAGILGQPTSREAGPALNSILFTFNDLVSLPSMLKAAVAQHVNTTQVPALAEDDPALTAMAGAYQISREGPRYDVRLI